MLSRLLQASRRIITAHSFHSNTPNIQPRNTEHVSRPSTKLVRILHKLSVKRVVGFGLHCNVEHKNALREKYYWRVKINGLPLNKTRRDTHMLRVGDFFTLDTRVYDMQNGIYYKTKRAEIVKLEKRDLKAYPPKPKKPGMRQLVKSTSDKWKHLVTLCITVTTKKFFRRIMYSDIPKKGHEAFKLLVRLSPYRPIKEEEEVSHSEDELSNLESDNSL